MIKRLADCFFRWFCRSEYYQDIRGDLEELYRQRVLSHSLWFAEWMFLKEVLLLLRLSIIKPLTYSRFNLNTIMVQHHIKIALRQIRKQKLHTFIKVGGFSIGIAACLLLSLYLRHELNYDVHYTQKDRLYRVYMEMNTSFIKDSQIFLPAPFAEVVEQKVPEIEEAARYASPAFLTDNVYIQIKGQPQNMYEEGLTFFDPELVELLEIPMIFGDAATALAQPNTLIISQRKANKYFGSENPVGETLILNGDKENPFTVGGVMENFPSTSHMQFEILLTMQGREFWKGEQTFWGANNYGVYLLLKPEVNPAEVEYKLADIISEYIIPAWLQGGYIDSDAYVDSLYLGLQPISDIHLESRIDDKLAHGDIRLIWLFGATVFIILFIACINFVNLSTARSTHRAREVGLKKVIGAHRYQIANQFLTESILYSFFSFGLGLLLAHITLPYFNELAGRSLTFPWQEPYFIPLLICSALIIGIGSGVYPSFYLSAFRPIQVIKGNLSTGSRHPFLRSTLVVFQFATSVILIISTIVIYQQMQYILNKKVGFNKEQVILIQGTDNLEERAIVLKKELAQLPSIRNVSLSDYLPISGSKRNGNLFSKAGERGEEAGVAGQYWRVDEDYIATMGMEILAGRNFVTSMPTDSQSVIVNEAMVRELGLIDPIGKQITNGDDASPIIGVVSDFHFNSFREQVKPVAFRMRNGYSSVLAVKAGTEDMKGLLGSIKEIWDEVAPNQPIRYTFLDESFARMYEDVQRSGDLFNSFALLAIIIACMGLLGLTAFITEQRRKEIGIRKVLGASVSGMVRLLSKEFLLLTLLSIIIASPIAWYIMHKWLEGFEYRIDIQWYVYGIAGGMTMLIALLTMSFHTIRAASINPIHSLRQE